MAKKYTYVVNITRKVSCAGDFEVVSSEKLTEDEVIEKAREMAFEGDEPDNGWEELETSYEDEEIQDGHDNLKEE